jgi:hypothetical protein
MKTLASMLLACLLIPTARADDGTLMAIAGQVLIGTEAGRGWTFVEVGPGQYDVRGETHGVTYEQILAATNRADVLVAFAATGAPNEVERVAYTTGWSESIDDDGTPIRWRTHMSPYDPSGDRHRRDQAKSTARETAVDMAVLRTSITNDLARADASISQSTQIVARVQALTFSTTPTRAQVQALQAQVLELSRLVRDLSRADKEQLQTDRKLRRAIMQEAE